MPKGCLYYIHMGKTGGGTINKWLYTLIKHRLCFQGQFDGVNRLTGMSSVDAAAHALSQLKSRRQKSLRFVTGHLPLYLKEHLPQPVHCITVLREPIDREISTFYYLQSIGGTRGEHFKKSSIEQYSTHLSAADNYQVRILSGLEELNPIWNNQVNYPSIHGRTDILELAKENLKKHFVVVGLLEELDKFAITLAKFIRHRVLINLGKENVTQQRIPKQSISEPELEMLKKKVDLDLALYDWVKQQSHDGCFLADQFKLTPPSFFETLFREGTFPGRVKGKIEDVLFSLTN